MGAVYKPSCIKKYLFLFLPITACMRERDRQREREGESFPPFLVLGFACNSCQKMLPPASSFLSFCFPACNFSFLKCFLCLLFPMESRKEHISKEALIPAPTSR